MIECYFCEDCWQTVDGLEEHYESAHADDMAEVLVKSRSLTIRCDRCGRKKKRNTSQIANRQYCSDECYNDNRTIGVSNTYVEEQKAQARERDNYECQDCGVGQKDSNMRLDVHHLERAENFDVATEAHSLSNLLTLCRSCHLKREPRNTVD